MFTLQYRPSATGVHLGPTPLYMHLDFPSKSTCQCVFAAPDLETSTGVDSPSTVISSGISTSSPGWASPLYGGVPSRRRLAECALPTRWTKPTTDGMIGQRK
ncbi:hypothetical protein ACCO45_013254 [Purpureocillium lilacinum]|uniref:Uncharacterized protein n=1 Tax=Purpureocillium lilacinum TaxID=33203 RepID=A0ACC4DAC0_PURLI